MTLQIHFKEIPQELILYSVQGREAVSELFSFSLAVNSLGHVLSADQCLYKNLSFQIDSEFFHGMVCELSELTPSSYQLKIVPELWKLDQKKESRIFHDKNVLQIVESLVQGFELEWSAVRKSYFNRDICIQYQESDFEFIQRLLAEEGISYFFQFEQDRHVMILMDQASHFYYESPLFHCREKEDGYLLEWWENFKLKTDYVQAKSRYRGLRPYNLINLYRELDQHYLITELTHRAYDYTKVNFSETPVSEYCNYFRVICNLTFRAPIPAKTLIANAIIAKVAGTELEVPAMSSAGKLPLQFSWDQEKIPVWAPVAQWYTGPKMGMQFLPRVGDSVIVYFIEGDPECPVVCGALPSEDSMSLYALESSGLRTANQTHFNELRFDDQPNAELLYWHAARNLEWTIAHDAHLIAQDLKINLEQGDYEYNVGKSYELKAESSIELKVGDSAIKISPTKIVISALEIKIN